MKALIVAAHGDGDDSESNSWARELAQTVGRLGGYDESLAAFQKGEPGFAEAIDGLRSTRITVVPLMASAGYYARSVLPRELARNSRYSSVELEVTEPVGTLPQIWDLAEARVRELAGNHPLETTSVLVVGHGTRRHAHSRLSTEALRDQLRHRLPLKEVEAAFLDESPGPEAVMESLSGERVLVLPFLMGKGTHALSDIPRRTASRQVVIDQPLGTLPGIQRLTLLRAQAQPREGVAL